METEEELMDKILNYAKIGFKIVEDGTKNHLVEFFSTEKDYDYVWIEPTVENSTLMFSKKDRICISFDSEEELKDIKKVLLGFIGRLKYNKVYGIIDGDKELISSLPEFDNLSELSIKLDLMYGGTENVVNNSNGEKGKENA